MLSRPVSILNTGSGEPGASVPVSGQRSESLSRDSTEDVSTDIEGTSRPTGSGLLVPLFIGEVMGRPRRDFTKFEGLTLILRRT